MFLHILFILFLFLIVCTSPESAYEALDAAYKALDAAYRPGALRWYLQLVLLGCRCCSSARAALKRTNWQDVGTAEVEVL